MAFSPETAKPLNAPAEVLLRGPNSLSTDAPGGKDCHCEPHWLESPLSGPQSSFSPLLSSRLAPSKPLRLPLTPECIPRLILLMVQSGSSKALRTGLLAKAAGVSPDTIRHYERIGVLPRASRTESGYRIHLASSVERVLVVQRALRIGEADLEALKRTRRYVKTVLSDWDQRIRSTGPGQKSHLLYSLSDAVKKSGIPVNQFRRKKRP